jgi:uncharacterized membrane protein
MNAERSTVSIGKMDMRLIVAKTVLFAVDILWLFTGRQYSALMHTRIQKGPIRARYLAALPVYAGMAWLLLQATSVQQAALLGLSAYAIYDFTNYALLKDYELGFAIADTLWGAVLFAVAYLILEQIEAANLFGINKENRSKSVFLF